MADLNLKAGTNITLTQEDDDLYINSTTEEPDLSNYYTKTETNTLLNGKQDVSNLVTSVSSSSTDAQYPSAKLFYDTVGDVETLLEELDVGGGA